MNYISSVYDGAAFSSVADELATAVPTSVLQAIESLGIDATGDEFSSVVALLPADAQSFYLSIEHQASAIIASDLSVTATVTASGSGSTMSTAVMTSGTTTASGTTKSASTATSGSAASAASAASATTSAVTATSNAAIQPTAAIVAAGAAAAGILGFVALL